VVELPWAADRTVVRASVEAANRVTTNCCVRDGVVQMVSMLRGGRGWRGGGCRLGDALEVVHGAVVGVRHHGRAHDPAARVTHRLAARGRERLGVRGDVGGLSSCNRATTTQNPFKSLSLLLINCQQHQFWSSHLPPGWGSRARAWGATTGWT
jgi:hypothetical protein